MENWVTIDEFAKMVRLDISSIKKLIKDKDLKAKNIDGKIMIDAKTTSLIKRDGSSIAKNNGQTNGELGAAFVEKTIGTILNLHEKVIDSKDETLEALRNENQFLKDSLFSMQDLYEEDRKTIEALTKELEAVRDDLELAKRKYKLMWGKAIDNANKG